MAGRAFVVRGILVIGRAPECELHLADRKVSRRHAVLSLGRDSLIVHDDDSLNGTWVNDRRILDPVVARGGDRIRVGGSEFVVRERTTMGTRTRARRAGAGIEPSLTVPVPAGGHGGVRPRWSAGWSRDAPPRPGRRPGGPLPAPSRMRGRAAWAASSRRSTSSTTGRPRSR